MTKSRSFLTLLIGAVVVLAMACGGGGSKGGGSSSGSGPITEKEATAAAKGYFVTIFGVMSGSKQPQALIDSFAPECRDKAKASEIAAAFGLIRIFLPAMTQLKIEDVDFGKVKVEQTSDGANFTPEDPKAIRLKVGGKFQKPDDVFKDLGLGDGDNDAGPISTDDPLKLVRRDGKVYIGDCSQLGEFSMDTDNETPTPTPRSGATPTRPAGTPSASGTSASGTPSSAATATRTSGTPAPATGPGSSRTNPVPLGQTAVVDAKWQLSIVTSNKDAWPTVQAANRFNDTPTANQRLVVISVKAKNVSTTQTASKIDDFNFSLTGSGNQLYQPFSSQNRCGVVPNELDANLFPNGEATGNLCFKIPSSETGLLLVWEPDVGTQFTYFKID